LLCSPFRKGEFFELKAPFSSKNTKRCPSCSAWGGYWGRRTGVCEEGLGGERAAQGSYRSLGVPSARKQGCDLRDEEIKEKFAKGDPAVSAELAKLTAQEQHQICQAVRAKVTSLRSNVKTKLREWLLRLITAKATERKAMLVSAWLSTKQIPPEQLPVESFETAEIGEIVHSFFVYTAPVVSPAGDGEEEDTMTPATMWLSETGVLAVPFLLVDYPKMASALAADPALMTTPMCEAFGRFLHAALAIESSDDESSSECESSESSQSGSGNGDPPSKKSKKGDETSDED
jgi:hypothetical protein